MRDKDAQLIWEAMPGAPAPNSAVPQVPNSQVPQPTPDDPNVRMDHIVDTLIQSNERIQSLQQEIGALKTMVSKSNLKSLIWSLLTAALPFLASVKPDPSKLIDER
jgi:hypothetical protein